MNYIEQIRGFWRSHEEHSFSTTEVALYFYLLEVCNSCSWKNPFKRNNAKIEADLGISFKTLSTARNKLQQHGLIVLKTRNGYANVDYTLGKFPKVRDEVRDEVKDEVKDEVGDEVRTSKDKLNKNKTKREGMYSPATNNFFVGIDEDKPEEQPATVSYQTFVKPTVEEVEAYCKERGNRISAQKFVSYYQSNGWQVGRNPMKDWRAAIRAWEQNGFTDGKDKHNPPDPRFLGMLNIDMSDF